MPKAVFTLIEQRPQGQNFTVYKLVTAERHWYKLGVTKDIADLLPALAGSIVECEISDYSKKVTHKNGNTYEDITIYVRSIKEATGKLLEDFNAKKDAYNQAFVEGL